MAKLIWTEESLSSLKRIGEYLAERSPEAAATVTEGIWKKSQILISYPELGWRHDDIEGRNVRSLLYGHYRIIYELSAPDVAKVLTVIHSSMDVDRLQF